MVENIRMTQATMSILSLMLDNRESGLAGSDIASLSSLMSGTIYPILHRLVQSGWLTSELESIDPEIEGRPKRRFYKLTGEAQSRALFELNKRRFSGYNNGIKGGLGIA